MREAIMNGSLPPGSQVVETRIAAEFGVSRGPLREAIRALSNEGLLTTRSFGGAQVVALTDSDVREMHSLRTTLEIFAFELIWDHRDAAFRADLVARHEELQSCIDRQDDEASLLAELALHSLVYESTGHNLLKTVWHSLRGRVQLYWATLHRAHQRQGPKRDAHDDYVAAALGEDFEVMKSVIREHMKQGLARTPTAPEAEAR
nr:GntR family transcriptional regulator [Oceaniglobus trochenteri]